MRGAGWVRRLRKPYYRRLGLKPVLGRAPSGLLVQPRQGVMCFLGLYFAQFALLSLSNYVAKYILFFFFHLA